MEYRECFGGIFCEYSQYIRAHHSRYSNQCKPYRMRLLRVLLIPPVLGVFGSLILLIRPVLTGFRPPVPQFWNTKGVRYSEYWSMAYAGKHLRPFLPRNGPRPAQNTQKGSHPVCLHLPCKQVLHFSNRKSQVERGIAKKQLMYVAITCFVYGYRVWPVSLEGWRIRQ